MLARLLLGGAALLLALGTSGADHCTTWSTSQPEIDTGEYYVDNDLCQLQCLYSAWVYQETNGIPGLQRHDDVKDDTCHWMIDPDILPW